MAAPELLTALLEAPGPSGHEEEPARIWRAAAETFAEVSSDTLGTSFARARSAVVDAPTLALVGHIDEVGVSVTHIADNGLLSFVPLGGILADTLVGQRLELLTRNGRVPAAIGRKRLAPDERRERPKTEHADLHIDIGARSREDAERLVRVGDAGVWVGPPVELPNGRLLSSSLDNRLGAFIVLEAARRVAAATSARVDVVAVASVQEEIGSYGARPAAYELAPQVAIAVDVSPATDYPGGDPRRSGAVELGAGALISRGPTLNKQAVDLLVEVAEAEGIAHAFEAYARTTETDADEMHLVRGGVPTALVSIPLRYMHTPNELCALDDIEAVVRLLVAFALRLERGHTFVR